MKRLALLAVLVAALMAVTACGSAKPATTAGPTPANSPTIDASKILQTKCTVCHNLDRVNAQKLDAVGWSEVIDRMVSKGANLTPEEVAALAEYLSLR